MFQNQVFLTQTDTTIGFISQSADRLTSVKQRLPNKHYIRAVNSLQTLQMFTRVPNNYKKEVRRAKRTTFIMPNGQSFRLIRDKHHLLLLNRIQWAYTTSANLSGSTYDESFAKSVADIDITPLKSTQQASTILKIGKRKQQRIR